MPNLLPSKLIVRRIPERKREIYLTFDDGPEAGLTELVLDSLAEFEAQAAFFVIGSRAKKHPSLLQRIIREGHSIHSHSCDHNYLAYFRTPFYVKSWIKRSFQELEDLTGLKQELFRPPGGIIPPPVWLAASSLQVPLILWNHRFYDWVHPWREAKAERSLERMRAGDIILLHDWQREKTGLSSSVP